MLYEIVIVDKPYNTQDILAYIHIVLTGINITICVISMAIAFPQYIKDLWSNHQQNEKQEILEKQFEKLAKFVKDNENLYPLEFEREKNIIGAQAAAKYYLEWMP